MLTKTRWCRGIRCKWSAVKQSKTINLHLSSIRLTVVGGRMLGLQCVMISFICFVPRITAKLRFGYRSKVRRYHERIQGDQY
ncbi:hypothetical protein K432DRAFT_96200 [Lepidopterella palustris CBS 459.81]|uniref:Uncharacterized protein n=1 Tax=Lepidopterella palustris CBS 459.81 TaxID=1314670 RepID=A0A8E2E6K4_9PEZI|nr:hypothetical protein K432DRAFT_96200 [Lepidopterella palustris CBS 459.81]